MKVRVIKNKEALLLIKNEWDKIFLEGEYTIFQSFQFCYNSLNEKSKPFIICLENKNNRKLIKKINTRNVITYGIKRKNSENGYFIGPTLIDKVKSSMKSYENET